MSHEGPRVSAVVVSFNTREELLGCLQSLRDHARLPFETIVVDNASSDGSAEAVRATFPEVRLLENDHNRGFAAAVNRGLGKTEAPFVLLLNSDAQLRPGALGALLGFLLAHPEAAAVGPRVVGPGGAEVSFGPFPTLLSEWRQRRLVRGAQGRSARVTSEVEALTRRDAAPGWVSAACLLARKEALDRSGGLDEGFFLYHEDVDLCLRLRKAGWTLAFHPAAEVFHLRGKSMDRVPARARLEYHRSHLRLYRKHSGAVSILLLRLLLAARGGLGALSGSTPGERAEGRTLLRLGLLGS
jgi:N-acetylglucosaminyl-diphospho-decaprenol L-rhamnosyltransferase